MLAINDPVGWWGPPGRPPSPLSIVALLRAGTLSPRLAAGVWALLEWGGSLIIAAGPQRAGKTTILTALLSLLPHDTPAYYTQGDGESFAGLPRPPRANGPTFILINEISDHLPTYSWGPPVQAAFALLAQGYSLCGTMHSERVEECLRQLRHGCGVPAEQLTGCDLIMTLTLEPNRRRVAELFLQTREAAITRIGWWDRGADTHHVLETDDACTITAARLDRTPAELEATIAARSDWLQGLMDAGIDEPAAVETAVRAFHDRGNPRPHAS